MPTYEYACKGECGEHLEVHQSFTDPPLEVCPTCGGALRKVFGNIGISFKGSGFYKTDSRASSNGSKGKTSESSSSDTSKSSESTSSDAKTASKSSDAKSSDSTSSGSKTPSSTSGSSSKPAAPAAAAS